MDIGLDDEELQKFWEKCGFEYIPHAEFGHCWRCDTPWYSGCELPSPDSLEFLGFLFKYAVPKLVKEVGKARAAFILQHWVHLVTMDGEDSALALLRTLQEALNG